MPDKNITYRIFAEDDEMLLLIAETISELRKSTLETGHCYCVSKFKDKEKQANVWVQKNKHSFSISGRWEDK